MHNSASRFLNYVVEQLPEFFNHTRILDCGSGLNEDVMVRTFPGCEVVKNDVTGGRNVNYVKLTHELPFPPEYFDVILMTEYLQYDPYLYSSLERILDLLRPGGLIVFTCGGVGRAPTPEKSFGVRSRKPEFTNIYHNLNADWIRTQILNPNLFPERSLYYNAGPEKDLYGWGIKCGLDTPHYLTPYRSRNVFDVTNPVTDACAIVIQGPSTYAKRLYEHWSPLNLDVIASTWDSERNIYKFPHVIYNEVPARKGVVNLNMQKISTISGLYLAKEMGYRNALKIRSDLIPNNCVDLMKLFSNDIDVHAWANHHAGYFTDYYMQGPIDTMIQMWEFDGTAPCSYPEELITKNILKLGKKVNQMRHHLSPDNDIYSIKWNLNLSTWVPSFCSWGDPPH